MLYYYLVTLYKGIVGIVTPERLMGVALSALGIYVVWMCISLISSFQRKFNSRCQELINFVIRTKDIEKSPELIDKYADKISSGFGFGWKKFRNSEVGKPSDYISRRDALEVEVNGGLLNNGKTMMRAYISFVTIILAIFNFVYVGGENAITFMVFAESLILPFVFFVIIRLFYFLHNSIRQKLYKMDIESFYEVIDLLDSRFVKKGRFVSVETAEEEEEQPEEEPSEETAEAEEEPSEEDATLDKYDIFKKKNIDVTKLMNENPKSDTSLPFINVDSDYVIKDDDQVGSKQVGANDNASTIFGGMMQNTSGIKKNNFVDVDKKIAEVDEDKLEKLSQTAEEVIKEAEEEKKESDDTPIESTSSEESVVEETNEGSVSEVQEGKKFKVEVNLNDPVKIEPKGDDILNSDVTPNSNKFIEIEKNEDLALQEENIANVVSGFKANRSKLASGGMIIERNEPISKRDRGSYASEPIETPAPTPVQTPVSPTYEDRTKDINRPLVEDNAESVLNSLKSNGGVSYDTVYTGNQVFAPSTNYGSVDYNQGYGYNQQMMYQPQMNSPMNGYSYNNPQAYPNYNQAGYGMDIGGVQQSAEYDAYEEPEEVVQPAKTQKEIKKKVRTKENEPRPRNLKTSPKKSEKEEPKEMEKRGRPKKQEVSETMVIENDKQFNEVLARAEKLMRKNEEGLSESQSKRIEKEIKLLMDAMNRYKESK